MDVDKNRAGDLRKRRQVKRADELTEKLAEIIG